MITGNPPSKPFDRFFSYLVAILNRNKHTSKLFDFIMRNPLYRGVLVLGSGTAIAQLIAIITAPIITRIYTPSDMGVLATYSSLLAIIGIGAALRYELAFPLPKKDEDAINLFGLSLILLCITTVGLALVLVFGKELLFNTFNIGLNESYVWFLLIGFFGMGLYTILNYWAVRQRDYGRITRTKINQGAGGSITTILLGALSFGPVGLIAGHIISQVAGITTLARAMWIKEKKKLRSVTMSRMKSISKEYRSFPTFNLPASIINTLSLQLPPLILLALYDSNIVGFYALANMLVVLPGSLISSSMGQAYLGEASKMIREKSQGLRLLYTRTLKHLLIIGIPLIGIPALIAPIIVPFLFGEAWSEAGWYIWPLAAMAIAQFAISGIGYLSIYGYNHWALIWNAMRLIGVISAFYLSYLLSFPPILSLTIYSLIMVSMYFLSVLLNLKAILNYTKKMESSNKI